MLQKLRILIMRLPEKTFEMILTFFYIDRFLSYQQNYIIYKEKGQHIFISAHCQPLVQVVEEPSLGIFQESPCTRCGYPPFPSPSPSTPLNF